MAILLDERHEGTASPVMGADEVLNQGVAFLARPQEGNGQEFMPEALR